MLLQIKLNSTNCFFFTLCVCPQTNKWRKRKIWVMLLGFNAAGGHVIRMLGAAGDGNTEHLPKVRKLQLFLFMSPMLRTCLHQRLCSTNLRWTKFSGSIFMSSSCAFLDPRTIRRHNSFTCIRIVPTITPMRCTPQYGASRINNTQLTVDTMNWSSSWVIPLWQLYN